MNPSHYMYQPPGVGMYPMMGYGGMQGGMQQGMMPDTRDGFQEYGTFAEPNGILDPLTAVVFDPCEELIWTGTQTGRIVGYRAPNMQKYACWRAHYDDVRQVLLNEQGVTSISMNNIRFYSREGKLQLSYSQEELQELVCAMWTTQAQTSFLVGSRQHPAFHIFDLRRGRVVKDIPVESCTTIMARNSRQVCIGHADGSVTIRDPRSLRVENSLKLHQTHVMAMDVKNDLMASCGYIQRGPRTVLEHTIRVYDLRMMRMLQSIRFDDGAFFIKFHPSLSSTVLAASPSGGNIQMLDVSQTGGHVSHQWYIDSPSQEIFCADVSSSAECLAFGDADGYTHLWTSTNIPSHSRPYTVNLYSHGKLENMSARPPAPSFSVGESLLSLPWVAPLLNSSSTPYNVMTSMEEHQSSDPSQPPRTPENRFSTSTLRPPSSATPPPPPPPRSLTPTLPQEGFFSKGTPSADWNAYGRREPPLSTIANDLFHPSKVPEPIDPELIKLMRVSSGIGVIATEPGTRKRNLARDAFRDHPSLQEVRTDLSSQFEEAYEDMLPAGTPMKGGSAPTSKSKAPRPFRLIPAHHPSGRFGFFDYPQYNRTEYVGLENLGRMSSLCNPILQLIYWIPQLRSLAQNHLCTADNCMLCELGFLFHMIQLQTEDENSNKTCSTKNFLRAMKLLPKASASGLLDEEAYASLPNLVEKFCRFLLTQMNDEAQHNKLTQGVQASAIVDQLLGSDLLSRRRCSSCGAETVTHSKSFGFKLKCPTDSDDIDHSITKAETFGSMFARTLVQRSQSHSYCERCVTFQLSSVVHEVEVLPPILNVFCSMTESSKNEAFWRSVTDDYTPSRSVAVDHWIPYYLTIFKDTSQPTEPWVVQEFDKLPQELEQHATAAIYELSAVVSSIKDDEYRHTVSQIRTAADQWHIFNDFHVAPCGRLDAVHISSEWKTPSVVHYTRRDTASVFPPAPIVNPILESAFFSDCPTPGTDPLTRPEQLDELEKEIAIDAEFVLLKEEQVDDSLEGLKQIVSPNEFGVARISLIGTRKDTHQERCLMDDYVASDASSIVDYLTQFSGILPGDLDKSTSKHHVISLKSVYLKLRYLVDRGCVFVGHGLSKDFSTINIVVPPHQVIDTVTIFHLENQRMISLRFLASVLLGIDIQQTTHDSIEDSRTALQLYRRYQELVKEGQFDDVLQEIYAIGRRRMWKVQAAAGAGASVGLASPASSAPLRPETPTDSLQDSDSTRGSFSED